MNGFSTTVAEFRSVVKDTDSNTKNFTKSIQFIVTTRVYIFGKCLCLAFSSLRKIWTPELLRITKNQSDVTNSRWYNFFVNNLYIGQFPQKNSISFATVKFHISFEKRLKLGEQRKIPGVNITKLFANLSAH